MSRNDSFVIYDEKRRVVRERLSYLSQKTTDEGYMQKLKEELSKGNISITCSCSNKIAMKVSNTSPPFLYPASRTKSHAIDCIRNPNCVERSDYERAWTFDEDKGNLVVRLKQGHWKQQSNKLKSLFVQANIFEHNEETHQDEVTLYGLVTKLNWVSWQNIVEGKKRLPTDWKDVAKHMWGAAKQICLENTGNQSFQQQFYESFFRQKDKRIANMKVREDTVFVYMRYQGHTNSTITLESSVWNKTIDFILTDMYVLERELARHADMDIVIAGFAVRASENHYNYLTLSHYCVLPLTDQGLFVRNCFEREVANELYAKKVMYTRPLTGVSGYNDYIPDFILTSRKIPILFEVFEPKDHPDADPLRTEKLKFTTNKGFRERFHFWYRNG